MSSTSSNSTASGSPSATSSGTSTAIQLPSSLKTVGILLAIVSGILIGTSFVFKKKGLLKSQAGGTAGEGVAYLKSWMWWIGMSMMILGELCNFAAYAFVEAIVVTPFGALAVVISAVLASIFLNEKLTFFGWLGCGLCILGSVIIALNGPSEPSVGQITEFQKLFLAPGFLAFGGVLIAASLIIIFFIAPKYGKTNMIWYILICSMIGGISVSVTTGLGAAIVTTIMNDNQFKHWFIYFLLGFVTVTLVTEIYYLNVALALFNTAMVTPTYYVLFTFCSMLSTIVLFKGLKAPVTQIITLVMGFLVICFGIVILQMSRVDPKELKVLDRKSTILMQAARARTENSDMDGDEKSIAGIEDPGMDSLRGSFGAIGSIIRARSASKMSRKMSHNDGELRSRYPRTPNSESIDAAIADGGYFHGMKRHQLYDEPMPARDVSFSESLRSDPSLPRHPTIKFDTENLVHSYGPGGDATHEHRKAAHLPPLLQPVDLDDDPFGTPIEGPGDRFSTMAVVDGGPSSFSQSTTTITMSPPEIDSPSNSFVSSGHPRTSSGRNYPRGDESDDRDESRRLWTHAYADEEGGRGSDLDGSEVASGGIRLVTKSRT